MREESLFHADQKNQRELEPFGGMQRHQRDSRVSVVLICVTHQRGVIEKFVETLAAIARIPRRIYQFLKIFNTGEGLRRRLFFELLHVSAAVDEEFDHLWNSGGIARRAKALWSCFRRSLICRLSIDNLLLW